MRHREVPVMKNPVLPVILLPLVLVSGPPASAGDGSLAQCQRLKDRMEHYTVKRRGGGSNSQMRTWKRARLQSQEQFKRYRCARYGRQLE